MRRNVKNLKKTICELVENEGEVLPSSLNDICSEVISNTTCNFDPESAQYLLWEEQKKQAALSNKKSMRWHPVMIRWCISIFLKSPGTYELLRNSGFLKLPSRKKLQKYTNFTDPKCGFNPDVFQSLLKEAQKFKENQHIGIVHDEMKIKSGLVFRLV